MTSYAIESLKTTVALKVGATATQQIRDTIVDKLAAAIVDADATAIHEGYNALNKLYGELKKIDRPDVVKLDRAGAQVDSSFSAERVKKIKETEATIKRWEEALDAAWGNSPIVNDGNIPRDTTKLKELLKKGVNVSESSGE